LKKDGIDDLPAATPTAAELWDWPLAKRTRWLARSFGVTPRKSLSQSFLINDPAAERLAGMVAELGAPGIVEIGGGLGALTVPLVRTAPKLIVYEIDPLLCEALTHLLSPAGERAKLVGGDFLEADPAADGAGDGWVAMGNLPYSVTTPILEKLFLGPPAWKTLLVMVQKEFAQRMAAGPGSRTYGSLSVFARFYCHEIQPVMELKPGSFWPQPKVSSSVVRLDLREGAHEAVKDAGRFFEVVRGAFGYRRKTLLRALATAAPMGASEEEIAAGIAAAGLDPKQRPETLGIEEFAALAEGVAKAVESAGEKGL
jgi:16S rRNA (adenine1518-N6/adenine1519-N6)-dimethyltransferase